MTPWRIVLVAVLGKLIFGDPVPPLAMAGMVLIVGGVVLVSASGVKPHQELTVPMIAPEKPIEMAEAGASVATYASVKGGCFRGSVLKSPATVAESSHAEP